ncbi:MAG: putative signal transducing protein [Planctomycetota bacterium]
MVRIGSFDDLTRAKMAQNLLALADIPTHLANEHGARYAHGLLLPQQCSYDLYIPRAQLAAAHAILARQGPEQALREDCAVGELPEDERYDDAEALRDPCPECGSRCVGPHYPLRPLVILSGGLLFPLLLYRRHRCRACGHRW